MTTLVVALCIIGVVVLAGGGMYWRRVVLPRRHRAAAALYADVQLQLLTQAALAALLDEVRQALIEPDRRTP